MEGSIRRLTSGWSTGRNVLAYKSGGGGEGEKRERETNCLQTVAMTDRRYSYTFPLKAEKGVLYQ